MTTPTVIYDSSCLNEDDVGQNSSIVCVAVAGQAVACMSPPNVTYTTTADASCDQPSVGSQCSNPSPTSTQITFNED